MLHQHYHFVVEDGRVAFLVEEHDALGIGPRPSRGHVGTHNCALELLLPCLEESLITLQVEEIPPVLEGTKVRQTIASRHFSQRQISWRLLHRSSTTTKRRINCRHRRRHWRRHIYYASATDQSGNLHNPANPEFSYHNSCYFQSICKLQFAADSPLCTQRTLATA